MDQLLKGILSADNLQDSLKRHLVRVKILPNAALPIESETCRCLLDMSWNLAVSSDKLLDKETGLKVFQAWVPHNRDTVELWASPDHIRDLLAKVDPSTDRTTLFQLLMFLLDNMEPTSGTYASSLTAVCQGAPHALPGSQGPDPLVAYAQLLQRFPRRKALQPALHLLRATALLHVQLPVQEVFKQKMDMIGLCLKGVLTEEQSVTLVVLDLLQELLASKGQPCSPALATIVEVLALTDADIESHCLRAVSMAMNDDQTLRLVLQRLLSWLCWPQATNLRNWVLCFLMTCNKMQKRALVESVLISSLKEMLDAMVYPNTREAAFMVFQYIVLVYHQCPGVMRKVLDLTPSVIQVVCSQPDSATFASCLHKQLVRAKTQLEIGLGYYGMEKKVVRPGGNQLGLPSVQDQSPKSFLIHEPASTSKFLISAGLENLGNTCYINSVVQALNMTYRFRHLVLQWAQDSRLRVLTQLQEVLAFLLLTKRPVYCPRNFLEVARPSWFTPGEQQDSQEFLSHLFDLLEEEQKAFGSGSPFVQQVFGGTTETCITCSLCEKTSITADLFYNLLLPLSGMESSDGGGGTTPSPVSLDDVLSSYLKPELLEGRNKYRCDNCNTLEDARRRIRITSAPQNLVLTLLRFEYESNRRRKISVPVCLPRTLQLPTETVDGGHSVASYCLYAAVMHSGSSAEKGHYFTYARCSVSGHAPGMAEDGWYLFNDERVSRASFQTLRDVSQNSCRDTVYMLFYSRDDQIPSGESPLAMVGQKLRELVLVDNLKYIKEEQQKAVSRRQGKSGDGQQQRRDSNEDPPPPPAPGSGSCGLGGGFGSFNSPSHVIF